MKKMLYLTLFTLTLIGCSEDPTDVCAEYISARCMDGKIILRFTESPRDVYLEEVIGTVIIEGLPPSLYTHGTFTRFEVDGNKAIVNPYGVRKPNEILFLDIKWRCGENLCGRKKNASDAQDRDASTGRTDLPALLTQESK